MIGHCGASTYPTHCYHLYFIRVCLCFYSDDVCPESDFWIIHSTYLQWNTLSTARIISNISATCISSIADAQPLLHIILVTAHYVVSEKWPICTFLRSWKFCSAKFMTIGAFHQDDSGRAGRFNRCITPDHPILSCKLSHRVVLGSKAESESYRSASAAVSKL